MPVIRFLVEYYTIIFVWLTGLTALLLYRRSWPVSLRILAAYLILYLVADTVGTIMASHATNNHFLYNILFNIGFLISGYFYYNRLTGTLARFLIRVFFFLFPVILLVNTFFFQGFFTWQTYSYVAGGSFIILFAVLYIWELYLSEETQSIFKDPAFWFSLSWLFFYIVTVPYFGMLNYLFKSYPTFTLNYYLLVIDVTDCLHNVLLTTGFLCLRTRTK